MVVTGGTVEVSVAVYLSPGPLQTEGVEGVGRSDPGTVGGGTSERRDRWGKPRVWDTAVTDQIIAHVVSHHGLTRPPAALAGVAPAA